MDTERQPPITKKHMCKQTFK